MVYTVPLGYTLMINSITISSTAASIDKSTLTFTMRGNVNEGARTTVGLEYPIWEGMVAGTSTQCTFTDPMFIPALVDLRVVAVGNAAADAATASCEWRGCLVAD
jgi:hypothetical protein